MNKKIPKETYEYLQTHPKTTSLEMLKAGVSKSDRSARRHKMYFNLGWAVPNISEEVLEKNIETQKEYTQRPTARREYLKAAIFDLETTDFGTEGFSGYLLCCCILPLDSEKTQTISIRFDEHSDDRRVLAETIKALSEYSILIGHNVAAYDINWLNSRLMFHCLPPMHTAVIFDTYQAARNLGLKTRKSLGNLIDYFGLDGEKTSIYKTSWNNVRSPYQADFDKAMTEIQYHCEQDVRANRALFDRLWPYSINVKNASPFKVSKFLYGVW